MAGVITPPINLLAEVNKATEILRQFGYTVLPPHSKKRLGAMRLLDQRVTEMLGTEQVVRDLMPRLIRELTPFIKHSEAPDREAPYLGLIQHTIKFEFFDPKEAL